MRKTSLSQKRKLSAAAAGGSLHEYSPSTSRLARHIYVQRRHFLHSNVSPVLADAGGHLRALHPGLTSATGVRFTINRSSLGDTGRPGFFVETFPAESVRNTATQHATAHANHWLKNRVVAIIRKSRHVLGAISFSECTYFVNNGEKPAPIV